MAHQLHNIYEFDNEYETLLDLSFQHAPNSNNSTDSTNSISSNNNDSQISSWIIHDPLVTYPLQQYIPGVLLFFNPNVNQITEPRIPTCKSCKNPTTRFLFSYLSPIPEEIISVPLHKRKHLSPVYLHCSLGRTPNSNPYTEYRSLTGTMGYSRNIRAQTLYSGSLDKLLHSLNNQLPTNLHSIIQSQLETLKILPYIFLLTATLELPADQYNAILIISMYIGRTSNSKWSYYFITGSAGTGKSYIIYIIIKMLEQKNSSYLLLAPTGVAAQNIGGKTIYSKLQITSTQTGFISKAFADKDFKTYLQKLTH
ncbi:22150_t:CDS:2 [Gigaspora margarita]|uniref:ATP-dependent DNA helicase n=1 Tax=Gigaspora margarita TaxID=4874 RepID=A0ABN7US70_GIGMA|nr:22150_t:CDS:2 [Gigaspora margarita]